MSTSFEGFEKNTTLSIPESFLLKVVAFEKGSVIRIVSYVMRKSLSGEKEVQASYEDFRREMKLSRQAVQEGLARALSAGYIRLVRSGANLPNSYTLNWQNGEDTLSETNTSNDPEDGEPTEKEKEVTSTQKGYVAWKAECSTSGNPYPTNQTTNHQPDYQTTASTHFNSRSSFQTDYSYSKISNNLEVEINLESTSPHRKPDYQQSTYLTNLTRDFSRELGDLPHLYSNLTQTHNLWQKSGMSEKDFAALLYEARLLTKRFATLRPGLPLPPLGQPRNRMAYFFTVVRDLLTRTSSSSSFSSSSSHRGYATPENIPPAQSSTSKNLRPKSYSNVPKPGEIPESWKRYINPPPPEFYLEGMSDV